jgi:hypothetical protein
MSFTIYKSERKSQMHCECQYKLGATWLGLLQHSRSPCHGALADFFQRRRLRVRAAFFAAAERDRAERRAAARFACRDNALFDVDRRLSRFNAPFVARERLREAFLLRPPRPFARSRLAWLFVRALPRFGGGNFTPALLALERPMAIVCSGDLAPCSPSRICSISSRTNSPAWVEGDLPSRSSSRALSAASSGIAILVRP